VPPLTSGAHVIVDSSDAEADRKFLRDVLGLESVDAGGGWLIYPDKALPRPLNRVRSMLPLTYRQALANRRFRLFTLGFGVSSLGDGMSALAVAWLAIEMGAALLE